VVKPFRLLYSLAASAATRTAALAKALLSSPRNTVLKFKAFLQTLQDMIAYLNKLEAA
jgi:hypothetical protein